MIDRKTGSVWHELQASLELKLNNVGNMLKRAGYQDSSRDTDITCSMEISLSEAADDQDMILLVNIALDFRVHTGRHTGRLLYLSISGSSSDNAEQFSHADLILKPENQYRQTVDIISRLRNWDELVDLRFEDKLLLKFTISSSPGPSPKDVPGTNHIYRSILNEKPPYATRFTAFSHRTSSGRLTRRRTYVSSREQTFKRLLKPFCLRPLLIDFEEGVDEEEDRKPKRQCKSQSVERDKDSESVSQRIDEFTDGKIPHAGEVVKEIFRRMSMNQV
ncbi:hypothetical protein OBBRIDRAFT_866130 [Obba rivulosa]|uniref:Uncharacterized protein n=1 Tax=Obba rivulosa TaxID=1052685 RepID=A0A8E2B0N0_9APHY|nr:hypothetical protein OBBRIDRAFT_866130 [Obba rivulosa]